MNRKIIFVLFSTLCLFNNIQFWRITLYDSVHVTGNSINITGDKECVNLENDREFWNKKTSSVETHGTCVVLYAQYDCQSESLTITPYTPNRQYLPNLNFNDKTSSIGPCLHIPEWWVTLYDNTYHTGNSFDYKGNEKCVNMKDDRNYFNNRASSADTHAGCVVLYDQFDCHSESVILSPYSPHHGELGWLNYINKTSSIGPCSFEPTTTTTTPTTIETIGREIRLHNNCPYTVWPGILGDNGKGQPENGGFELGVQQTKVITIENNWSGMIWGRTECDDNGYCETGDCGDRIECNGDGGESPATLVMMTLAGADGVDFYEISLVDGFNLPMSMVATDGFKRIRNNKHDCGEAGCPFDLNSRCPQELSVKSGERTVACNSACNQFYTDEYCCRGKYNSPKTCNSTIWAINYPAVFKRDCPNAFSYPFDGQSLFTCRGDPLVNYEITFCPSIDTKLFI